ncbi:unnamed protein product [Cylicocyclus nassatus]|uniref:PLC-beta PH domain-containing protein n=1 Tax=Cylicocyclus nassatus TaxID=53992 RepID=A0AA36DLW4_CYLNA|nr:unnamed protein product [Cylicocyclus nassatus]
MCETDVPSFFTRGSKFLLLDGKNDSLKPIQKVTLRVDPHGHIVYWKPWNVESQRNYIFTQDIVDVRTGKATNRQSNSDNIRTSIHDNVLATCLMTVVDNVDFIHPNYTTLAYLEDNVKNLKTWAEFLFQLSYRRRRRHYGVLHHVRKRLAPFLYASNIERASEQDVRYYLERLAKYGDCSLCCARTNNGRHRSFEEVSQGRHIDYGRRITEMCGYY